MAAQPLGYFSHQEQWEDPGNPFRLPGMPELREYDMATCAHCGTVVILNPRRVRPREKCYSPRCLGAYVCDKRVCVVECNPIIKSLDLAVRHRGAGPFLVRGKEGEVLYNPLTPGNERIF